MEAATAQTSPAVVYLDHDQSPELGDLAKALALAQGEMEPALKDSTNPDFDSKYATLASVIDASRGPLSRNGIAILQRVSTRPGFVSVTTHMIHGSGQWVSDRAELAVAQKNAQAAGSAITYLRRYALSALVGVACEDDDGAAATKPSTDEQPSGEQRQEARRQSGQSTDPKRARVAKLWKAAQAKGMSEERFRAWATEVLGAEKSIDTITPKDVLHLERALRELDAAKKDEPAGKEAVTDAAQH
jgi:hypothetical protein